MKTSVAILLIIAVAASTLLYLSGRHAAPLAKATESPPLLPPAVDSDTEPAGGLDPITPHPITAGGAEAGRELAPTAPPAEEPVERESDPSESLPEAGDETFESKMLAKYAGFSPARMRAEADVLSRELLDLTAPVYQKMFDMGHYEIVGYVLDGSLPIPTEDDELLTQYRVEHESVGGAVKRVELRPEEFPHEYSLRHEIDWLKGNERDALK